MFGYMLVVILQDIVFGQFDYQLLYWIYVELVIVQVVQQEFVSEMVCGDIDCDVKMVVVRKSVQVVSGFGNYIVGERDDQIIVFGDGDKYFW